MQARPSRRRVRNPRQDLEQRALARAVLSHDAQNLARLDFQVQVPQDRKSTRLTPVTNAHLVCRLLLEKKNHKVKSREERINHSHHTLSTLRKTNYIIQLL